jgi:4-hydroxybenzoate polyprenyltransferase
MQRLPFALIKAMRPKQAPKNLFVYAALVFTGNLFAPALLLKTTLAFLLFTLTAGSIYLLNDLLDVEKDQRHPVKCKRPIASGALPKPVAWFAMVLFSLGSLVASFALSRLFALAVLSYFVLQVAYCFRLKHIVLVDVFTVAAGFVLRTVAGGFVLHVHVSQWLLLCSLQLALFLAFGKRRQELVLMGERAGHSRTILEEYSLPFLDQMITIVCAVTVVCYSVYSIESETAHKHPHLWLTVPPVIFGICRYLYLVYQKGWGGAPDEVLLKDRPLQAVVGVWLILALFLLKFDPAAFGWLNRI